MGVYAEKKDGQLTGRFRVELQRVGERYRKRWATHAAALKDEDRVLKAWEAGESVASEKVVTPPPAPDTLAVVIPLADGMLWKGDSTEKTNFAHLWAIADILGRGTRLDDIDTHAVDKVIKGLAKLGKADGTINRYLSHLRTFLVWAKKRKYRSAPVEGEDGVEFSWREESAGRIRWITRDEEAQLKDLLPDNVWKLVKVAIETGCRRDELLTVELDQINGTRLHLWKTKTDTPRTVPMSQETAALLTELVTSGTMPSRRNLRSWWDRTKKRMGLEDDQDFVFHTCRHTRATRMVDAGINIFVIKEWMGHKRIETTLRYAHVKQQNLEDALDQVGEYFAKLDGKSRKSAGPDVPHAGGEGGENAPFSMAA